MKILFLTQYYVPEMGAPQARISELAIRMRRKGYDVSVLTAMPNYPTGKVFSNYRGCFFKKEIIDNIKVYRSWILPSKSKNILIRLISYFSFVVSSLIYGIFSFSNLDIIFVESPPLFLGISGKILAIKTSSKLLFNISDLWPSSALDMGVISNGWKYNLAKKLEMWCYTSSDAITGQSNTIVNTIKAQVRKPVFLLTNGVDIKKYNPKNKSMDIKKYYGLEDRFVFVYAGLLGMAQGIEQILDIAKSLKNYSDIKFLLIGDGPTKSDLVNKTIEEDITNVVFHDPISKSDIAKVIASMDAAIIPLKTKIQGAVPSKIYEALASGLPILFMGYGDAVDILEKNSCGICVDPGNINAASKIILEIFRDERLRKCMINNGIKLVQERFSRDSIADDFDNILRTVVLKTNG